MNWFTYSIYRTGLSFRKEPFGCMVILAVVAGLVLAILVNL